MVNWEDYISLPDVEALDWEGSAKINKEYLKTDNVRQIAFLSCLWERLISLMDVENAAVALIIGALLLIFCFRLTKEDVVRYQAEIDKRA